ncbi:MAG: tRNA (guanosine(37)-N1)-methyltransferase TrmD [Paenibacillaceae bacterium]|nr:tRNA (guanosine(37)-N1)-methyltransferase TrmD [Paenibacillaceae bacterium]
MRIDVLTLFPDMFDGVFAASILGKARDKGIVSLHTLNFREFAVGKHNTVDDAPYGGGGGMVLKPEPIFAAVEHVLEQAETSRDERENPETAVAGDLAAERSADGGRRVILMCPQGEPFTQRKAEELAGAEHLVFICGHYEGYDERIRQFLVTDELSIGDYVLTGGELPAMVVIDSVVRLLPGVLGNEQSAVADSFSTGLLEHPHYTRPATFRDWPVPDILLSGHHDNIEKWRRQESLARTHSRRPELLKDAPLTDKERKLIAEWDRLREQEGGSDSE